MNNIDEALQRFGGQMYGAGSATPGMSFPPTPMNAYIPAPPAPTPVYTMQSPIGQMISAQQMAYQQISQGYMSPATAFTAGAQFSGFASPAQWTMPGMGNFRPLAPPPPPPMSMTPGVTASFINPYDAGIAGMMQRQQYIYGDPGYARSRYSGTVSDEFQASGAGMMTGLGGAMLGGALMGAKWGSWGGFAGSAIGGFAGMAAGGLYGFGKSIWDYNAVQDMSVATRLQGGTHGLLSLGAGASGMGGRGMNAMAAMGLGKQLQGLAGSTGGSANINDMIGLTNIAAETGLLNDATNMDQIFSTIKKLTGFVGQMAKLTGDPNFQNNMREIANMYRSGFSIDAAPGVISSLNSSARMAGLSRGQMQPYMAMGASIFGSTGLLTTGLGEQYGAFAQGATRMGMGAWSPAQMNLLGGEQGIQQRLTQVGASTLSGSMQFLLPYLVKEGQEGLGVDKDAIAQFLSGKADLATMMSKGPRNLSMRGRSQLFTRQGELTSGIAEAMGPFGMMQATNAIVQDVMRRTGVDYETASGTVLGTENGRMWSQLMQSQEYRDRLEGYASDEEKREGAAARERGAARVGAARDYRSLGSQFGRWREGNRQQSAWYDDPNRGWWDERQIRRGREMAIEASQREEEASMGYYTVKSGLEGAPEEFRKAATERMRGISAADIPLSGAMIEEIVGRREGGTIFGFSFAGRRASNNYLNRAAEGLPQDKALMQTIERVKENADVFSGSQQYVGNRSKWLSDQEKMTHGIPPALLMKAKRAATAIARQKDSEDKPLDWADIEKAIIAAVGEDVYNKNRDDFKKIIAGEMASSSDEAVKRKYFDMVDPAGVLAQGDVEKAQKNIDEMWEDLSEKASESGIVAGGTITEDDKAALMSFFSDSTAALAAITDEAQSDASMQFTTEEKQRGRKMLEGMSPAARKALTRIGQKIGAEAGFSRETLEKIVQSGLQGKGELSVLGGLSYLQGKTDQLSTLQGGDVSTASGEKAGASANAAQARAFLKMLPPAKVKTAGDQLAVAADAITMAAKLLQSVGKESSGVQAEPSTQAPPPPPTNKNLTIPTSQPKIPG